MQDFRDLIVWQRAHRLALDAYRITRRFPQAELFGLTSQIRRSAASIPANIAEGCGRGTDGDFARFLQIAMGSSSELEYHLILARDLELIDAPEFESITAQVIAVKKMLASLIDRVRRRMRKVECDPHPADTRHLTPDT